jgi:hypothetical protein
VNKTIRRRRGLGVFLPRKRSFSPRPPIQEEKRKGNTMVFDKAKARISTEINDRVTSPIRTSIVISVVAFIMAGIALILVVRNADR